MAKKTKAVMGRPEHDASDANRALVKVLTAAGLTQEEIAKHLKINRKTLAKHYANELESGWIEAIGEATTTIIEEMRSKTSDKRLDAAKFFLSRRGRGLWSETKQHEISGPNGGAIPVAQIDFDAMDYDTLEAMNNILDVALIEQQPEGEEADD